MAYRGVTVDRSYFDLALATQMASSAGFSSIHHYHLFFTSYIQGDNQSKGIFFGGSFDSEAGLAGFMQRICLPDRRAAAGTCACLLAGITGLGDWAGEYIGQVREVKDALLRRLTGCRVEERVSSMDRPYWDEGAEVGALSHYPGFSSSIYISTKDLPFNNNI